MDEERDLVEELARDLTPVRRLPRLRVAAAWVAALFVAGFAVQVLLGAPTPRFDLPVWRQVPFLLMLVGLGSLGAGALVAGLAGAVPGRGEAERIGRGVAVLGALVACTGAGLASSTWQGAPTNAVPASASLACLTRAGVLSALPSIAVIAFLARALLRRPLLGAGLAVVATAALGAFAVHASCGEAEPLHLLVGHLGAPLFAGLVLSLPVAAVLYGAARAGASQHA